MHKATGNIGSRHRADAPTDGQTGARRIAGLHSVGEVAHAPGVRVLAPRSGRPDRRQGEEGATCCTLANPADVAPRARSRSSGGVTRPAPAAPSASSQRWPRSAADPLRRAFAGGSLPEWESTSRMQPQSHQRFASTTRTANSRHTCPCPRADVRIDAPAHGQRTGRRGPIWGEVRGVPPPSSRILPSAPPPKPPEGRR